MLIPLRNCHNLEIDRVRVLCIHTYISLQQFTISLYLAMMILANSYATELNPGLPTKFPWWSVSSIFNSSGPKRHLPYWACACALLVCAKAVKWTDLGIYCDSCQQWFHTECQGMSINIYEIVGASNLSWQCLQFGLPHYTTSLFDTFSITMRN